MRKSNSEMGASVGILFFLILGSTYRQCFAGTFNETVQLFKYLENQSYKSVRPLADQTESLTVNVTAYLRGIFSLDEKNQRLTTSFALGLIWYSDILVWSPQDYGDVREASFDPHHVWIPELGILNSVQPNLGLPLTSSMKVVLQFNGRSFWYTGVYVETTCSIDISKYPFDYQYCDIIIGKTNSDGNVRLKSTDDNVSLISFDENDSWDVFKSEIGEQLQFDRVRLVIQLTLKRRYLYYVFSVIIPLFIVSFMNILSFKIPAQSGERISYGVSLFLTFIMLLNMFSESMPSVSSSVSIMQLYINTQMVCSLVSTAFSVGVVRLARSDSVTDIPRAVMWLYTTTHRNKKSISIFNKEEDPIVNAEVKVSKDDTVNETNDGHVLTVEDVTSFIDTACFVLALCIYVALSGLCLLAMLS